MVAIGRPAAHFAKLTAKNQLTLPKAITQAIGPAEYFDVMTRDGQIVLTPVRIQRAELAILLGEPEESGLSDDELVEQIRGIVEQLDRSPPRRAPDG